MLQKIGKDDHYSLHHFLQKFRTTASIARVPGSERPWPSGTADNIAEAAQLLFHDVQCDGVMMS